MKKLSLTALLLLMAILSVPSPVLSQDQPQIDEAITRSGSLTTLVQRGESVQGIEELLWFDFEGQQRWLAKKPANGAVLGSVLLVAGEELGLNGLHHLGSLRKMLPRHGWQTFFFNLNSAQDVAAQTLAALGQLSDEGPLVLLCEGFTCESLRNFNADTVGGRIYLNLPLSATSRITLDYRQSWQPSVQPTLILQEYPLSWSSELTLLGGYELHLLPASTAPSLDATVLRRIRGWFRRQMGGA